MGSHTNTLHAVINAWRNQDVEGVLAHLHEDITWNNSGGLREPLRGKAEMRAALQRMAGDIRESKWRVFGVAEVGDTVWMEGVDELIRKDGIRVVLPYAGVLEFQGDLILNWREYFQSALAEQALAGGGVPPQVEQMLDRAAVS
jgi:limonene-1,2-epoxide hydrolase